MLVPIQESTRPVLIVTKATALRLGLSNTGVITPQVGQDALYIPLCIERVTARYIDNLKFCLYDCRTSLGKFFSREIDKRKREWERTLRDNPNYTGIIDTNTERIDRILTKYVPRRIVYTSSSTLSRFSQIVLSTVAKHRPKGLSQFNRGFENDLILKAYYTYRLVYLCMEAEGNAMSIIHETMRCRYAQAHSPEERKKIERIYNDSDEWEPPESWVYIAARCKQLVEVVACTTPYDERKSIVDYVDRVVAKGRMCEILDEGCEPEISILCIELTEYLVTI